MNDWPDDRLDAAYRRLASTEASDDLAEETIAKLQRAGRNDRGTRPSTLLTGVRLRAAFGGTMLVLVVAAVIAGLSLRPVINGPESTSAGGSGGAQPTSIGGLPVQSVSEVLAAEASGSIKSDELVAIKGWYDPAFIPACPAETPHSGLIRTCASRDFVLTETPQQLVTHEGNETKGSAPQAPYLYAMEPDGSYVESVLPVADNDRPDSLKPVPVVVIGHFHDVRASLCPVADQATCDSAFVVDQLAWLNGKAYGPNVWVGTDEKGRTVQPRLDEAGVRTALAKSLGPDDVVVSMSAVGLVELMAFQPGRGVSGGSSEANPNVQWFVRVAGPAPGWPEMAFGDRMSGWFVVGDETGQLAAVGGWGFVSAIDPVYVPAVRKLASGYFALPTINQLSGGACAGVGEDATLQGSSTDPRIAWLVERVANRRRDVVWPAGYRARFDPDLEILDENGNVVLSEGDPVTGLCSGDINLLEPPFR